MIRSLIRAAGPALAALLIASAGPVAAQSNSPAERLSQHLRELARNPNSLSALIGAGQSALGVGDANAALGFFARADEQAPRNGHVKAGLARALLMLDNPRDALRMFDAAIDLGVPQAEIAGDRGLAYDLRGDPKRAQRDYALALSRGADDEITRRYALSLAMTGDRDAALRLLDPLLYKRDQAAWRARAFVLALTGDQAGADRIVRQVMPDRMADAMVPFLRRLPSLRPAEKAAAVHLGEMPADGVRAAAAAEAEAQVAAMAPLSQAARSGPQLARPAPPPPAVQPAATQPPPTAREERRRTARRQAVSAPPPAPAPAPMPAPPAAVAVAEAPNATSAGGGDLAEVIREIREAAQQDGARRWGGPAPAPVAAAAASPATPKPVAADPPAKAKAATEPPAKPAAVDPPAKAKPVPAKTKAKPAPPKAPARIWVQVAGGANQAAMPREWSRVKAKAPDAFRGKTAWTAPNRLLVGPFASDKEAQAFVNTLRKSGVSSFQWDSAAGQDVAKLGGK